MFVFFVRDKFPVRSACYTYVHIYTPREQLNVAFRGRPTGIKSKREPFKTNFRLVRGFFRLGGRARARSRTTYAHTLARSLARDDDDDDVPTRTTDAREHVEYGQRCHWWEVVVVLPGIRKSAKLELMELENIVANTVYLKAREGKRDDRRYVIVSAVNASSSDESYGYASYVVFYSLFVSVWSFSRPLFVYVPIIFDTYNVLNTWSAVCPLHCFHNVRYHHHTRHVNILSLTVTLPRLSISSTPYCAIIRCFYDTIAGE